jgi:hypothetical protein
MKRLWAIKELRGNAKGIFNRQLTITALLKAFLA